MEDTLCPVCNEIIRCRYPIKEEDGTTASWLFCVCGTIFHKNPIDLSFYNEKYVKQYLEGKRIPERFEYIERCYLPIIEEMTMGRKFLDVGFTLDHHIINLRQRGWISTGIELFDNPYIKGNFETYNFGRETYDLINFGHVLEIFNNPIAALAKAYVLLNKRGVLMITSVDAEAIWLVGMQRFGHWSSKERWIYFSERQFKKIVEALQFSIVLSRKNFSQRFLEWNDFHTILQKN